MKLPAHPQAHHRTKKGGRTPGASPIHPPPPSDTRYGAPNAGEEEEEDKKDAVAYAVAFVPGEEEDTMPFS